MTKRPTLTMIDLFAGCGGLSLGLEQAGFTPLLFSEINKDAAETYLANRQGHPIEDFRDVSTLTDAKIKSLKKRWRDQGIEQVDLVCGGPPCQGYSGIGHRRTFAVERREIPSNHLYKEMIRVIKAVQPKVFLFENVKGLLSGRWTKDGEKGEIFRDVLRDFTAIKGYDVRWSLVQAKDYGVPQNRPRVLIVGVSKDLNVDHSAHPIDAVSAGFLPKGTGGAPDLIDVLGDLVDPNYPKTLETTTYPSAARTKFQREMRTRLDGTVMAKGSPVTQHEYSDHSPQIREKFAYMLANNGEIPESMRTKKFAQRVLTPHWGESGPNITATSLADDFVHFSQARSLTVREWARLQCFPDWYDFRGPRTTGGHRRAGRPDQGIWDRDVPRYTQIGNAVPVRLAQAIGEHFATAILRRRPSR
jgi:DNA (cytosine-5)-methyltransferase 1